MKYLKINRDQTNIVTQNGQNKRSKKKTNRIANEQHVYSQPIALSSFFIWNF